MREPIERIIEGERGSKKFFLSGRRGHSTCDPIPVSSETNPTGRSGRQRNSIQRHEGTCKMADVFTNSDPGGCQTTRHGYVLQRSSGTIHSSLWQQNLVYHLAEI